MVTVASRKLMCPSDNPKIIPLEPKGRGGWNAAGHETTLRALRRSELNATLGNHGFEAVHWLIPEMRGYY